MIKAFELTIYSTLGSLFYGDTFIVNQQIFILLRPNDIKAQKWKCLNLSSQTIEELDIGTIILPVDIEVIVKRKKI